jgi:HSP20 family molecular chaperone IbpA
MTAFVDYDNHGPTRTDFMKGRVELNEAVEKGRSGQLNGPGDGKQNDAPEVRGYLIRRRVGSNPPREPLDPIEPFNPWQRRPMPQRPFRSPIMHNGPHEALTDVFEDEVSVRVYVDIFGYAKDEIQLNVTANTVEVRARTLYQRIAVPGPIEVEKVSSQYNNGVLTIRLPKKAGTHEKETQRIRIE